MLLFRAQILEADLLVDAEVLMWTDSICSDPAKARSLGVPLESYCEAYSEIDCRALKRIHDLEFGRFNNVTPAENQRLTAFQRAPSFSSPDVAYQGAGVRLIKLSHEELRCIRARETAIT
jgi:hypothetical protein